MYPASIASTNIVVTRDGIEIELVEMGRSYYGSTQANTYICDPGDVISYETNSQYRIRTLMADGTSETSVVGVKTYTVPENAIFVGIIL